MYTTELVPFFLLLNRYYARMLTRVDPGEWQALEAYCSYLNARRGMAGVQEPGTAALDAPAADALGEARLPDEAAEAIERAVRRIATAGEEDATELEYEFNRLFLGPEKPQAAPYETVYLSNERVLMRAHTLSVREAYLRSGFEVNAKNTEPDDHAAYECAFAAALLERQDKGAQAAFEAFVQEHLSRWVGIHTDQIREYTANAICLGFADLFDAVVAAACA